jgi:BirA family biotin operon repressor/biotin-[acetyl-CoA-carboxylase] ligase
MARSDPLDRRAIESLLNPGNYLNRVEVLDTVDSTQDALAAAAKEGFLLPGSCLVAEEQTAGKGRMGRTWLTEKGQALTFSYLTPNYFPRKPGWITVGSALAVSKALEEDAEIRIHIKWPNDLYVKGRKLAGLLAQPIQARDRSLVVTGIGLNVHAAPQGVPDDPRALPIALSEAAGRSFDRNALLASILNALDNLVKRFDIGETLFVAQGLRERSVLLGAQARFEWKKKVYEGRVLDHTDDLEIRLETGSGEILLPGETAHLLDFHPPRS